MAPFTTLPLEVLHTGPCVATRRARGARLGRPAAPARDYCLHDAAGRAVGTIAAAKRRPVIAAHAPTVYLKRS